MYGVVLNNGLGEIYATFGTFEECATFIREGGTRGLGKAAIVINPHGDDRDPMGKRAPRRRILTGPNAAKRETE